MTHQLNYLTGLDFIKQHFSILECNVIKKIFSKKDISTFANIDYEQDEVKKDIQDLKKKLLGIINRQKLLDNPDWLIEHEPLKASKEGRVIDKLAIVLNPILEDGKTIYSYPKNHKFKYEYLNYKKYLELIMSDKDKQSKINQEQFPLELLSKSNLLNDFEQLSELNVKNVKTVRGHEGELCFQCSIYFKSIKIAEFNGYEWFSGEELNIINKQLIKETLENENVFFILDKDQKNYKISKFDFLDLIEQLCIMKKDIKMII